MDFGCSGLYYSVDIPKCACLNGLAVLTKSANLPTYIIYKSVAGEGGRVASSEKHASKNNLKGTRNKN